MKTVACEGRQTSWGGYKASLTGTSHAARRKRAGYRDGGTKVPNSNHQNRFSATATRQEDGIKISVAGREEVNHSCWPQVTGKRCESKSGCHTKMDRNGL